MPDISQIKLPSGAVYNIKDAVARSTTGGGLRFRGVTTTPLTDESAIASYVVDGNTITASHGDLVVYGKKEFLFSSTDDKWHELGDNSALQDLAYKDSAEGTYTPHGTVSQPSFTGTASSVTVTAEDNTSGNYQPKGTVSAPTISVATAGATTTIKNPTKQTVATTVVAAAPDAAAPANSLTYYAVSGEVLSLYQLGYTTGDSITTDDVTVKTGDASYSASAPAFTGTKAQISGTVTPVGTVSQPTFSGTSETITVS